MSDPLNDSPASDGPKLAPIPPGPVKLPPLKLPPKPVLSGANSPGGLKPPMPLVPPSTPSTSPPVTELPKAPVPPVAPTSVPVKAEVPLPKPPVTPANSPAPAATPHLTAPRQAPKVAIKLQTTSTEVDAKGRSGAVPIDVSEDETKGQGDLIPAIAATVLALLALAVQLWTLFS